MSEQPSAALTPTSNSSPPTPPKVHLSIGDPAPLFALPSDQSTQISLDQYRGQFVALYFYPKDDTPMCTLQAVDFSARLADFAAHNCGILGVSRDPVKSHAKVRKKHALGIPLLSDEGGAIAALYGVWVQKSMYGKSYMTMERSTFLIDPQGQVAAIWRKVEAPGHADAVLEVLRARLAPTKD